MIISVDYIRKFRPIAHNISDERIALYITEAEHVDILPAIGADLYRKYTHLGIIKTNGSDLTTDESAVIYTQAEGDLPTEEYKLLNGGYWIDTNGITHYFDGLKAALAYLAYARFLRNHSTNVTAYGVVVKTGEDSTPADARTISAAALDAQRIGEAYLTAAVQYWNYWKSCSCTSKKGAGRSRFNAIG